MNYFGSMLLVLWSCVASLAQRQPVFFAFTLLAGVLLAAVCWWVCTHYSRLWNLAFHITTLDQVLCACAALLTLVFWVLFVSLTYTKDVAQETIDRFHEEVRSDVAWRNQISRRVYYMIKATGLEDFRNYPPPDEGQHFLIPLSQPGSRRILASVPANEALKRFREEDPFLSHVLSLPARMPEGIVVADEEAFFAHNRATNRHDSYPFRRAVDLVADWIKSKLDPETPKAVLVARLILTACFLLAQAIPFCVIGFAAYRDLKIST